MKRMTRVKRMALVLLPALALAAPAMAHKVNVFAYVEEETVYTESYFPDGRPVEQGKILVLDASENPLLEGKTDAEGLFSFPRPRADALTIVIDAGMGHKNTFFLQSSETEKSR